MKKEKGGFSLPWPLNWILYGAVIAVAGYFIGYLWSVLIVVVAVGWRSAGKKGSAPQDGFCRDRTRKRLARLVWSLLYLLLAAGCGVVFFMGLREDKSAWELSDWAVEIVGGGGFLVFTACFLYETYTDLRDAFFPAKSRLAQSIRAQLPYPEEAPPVEELFALVDRDIQANGQWFDRVAVGKEWVFGDDVTAISRIRAVFGQDEIKTHYTNGRRQSARVINLYIIDDRRQIQTTGLRNPKELQALLDCLKLRAPDALFPPYGQYSKYCSMSEEEWATVEREYQIRQNRRAQEAPVVQSSNDFIFTDLQGRRTSRFDRRTIEEQLSQLKEHGQHISLEPSELIPVPGLPGLELSRLECGVTDAGLTLIVVLRAAELYRAFVKPAEEREARDAFAGLLERREPPDFSDRSVWQPAQPVSTPRQRPQARLTLTDRSGATRDYESFSRRDVELAGEGLASGKYTVAALFVGPRYIYLKAGDKLDGRVTVNASRPDPDMLRVFETKCSDRQAAEWLLALADGDFSPDFSKWKDITRQLERESSKK